MLHVRKIAALALATALSFATNANAAPPPLEAAGLEAWLDGFLPLALQQGDLAGAVVVVVKDGRVLLQKGYGQADIAAGTPMDPQRTLVGVGSVSKLFTWTAVMQLVEQGKLDLDRDVNAYLDIQIPPAFGKPITLRNLMTHTGGFEERIKQYTVTGPGSQSLAAHMQLAPSPARIYPPGQVPAYSNYGTDLAGYIVERVSGQNFADYIDQHILQPLGMAHSSFRPVLPPALQADLARNYKQASAPPLPADPDELRESPSGGLRGTATDLTRFLLAHLQPGSPEAAKILRPETMALMHAPAFTPMPGAQPVALGFFRNDINGHRVLTHSGDLAGFHTDLQMLPDQNVGLFLNINSDGPGSVLAEAHNVRSALWHQFVDRYFPAAEIDEPTAPTAMQHAQLAAGEYAMSRQPSGDFMVALYTGVRLSIKANPDGTIETPPLLSLEKARAQTWREVAPFKWREVNGSTYLNMMTDGERVLAWLPGDESSAFLIERVGPLQSTALHFPLLAAAVAILAATLLRLPVIAHLRGQYGVTPVRTRRLALARRLALWGAGFGLLFLLGWVLLLAAVSSDIVTFNQALDPWIRLVQLLGVAAIAGTFAACWHAALTVRARRPAWAILGSVLLAMALLDLAWFSLEFSLLSVHLNY